MTEAITEYGNADFVERQLGLTPSVGQKIAAIITFAGSIEYHLERALWKPQSIDPGEIKPDTNSKMISDLIAILETFAGSLAIGDERTLLERWRAAARSGFVIRRNIAHGVPIKPGTTLAYARNPTWHGEVRKREFGSFWAEEYTPDLVREAMVVLVRVIVHLSLDDVSLKDIAGPLALKALQTAHSVLGEFAKLRKIPSAADLPNRPDPNVEPTLKLHGLLLSTKVVE